MPGSSAEYGAQHVDRERNGTRETRQPSESGQRTSYKPSAKARAGQRESEGTVVVTRPATNNAGGAKGPCGGNVGRARTRERVTGMTGSNHPGRLMGRSALSLSPPGFWLAGANC